MTKDAILRAFREFFETNPDIVALRWHQYTPYFNDGDACVFEVDYFSFKLKEPPTPKELESVKHRIYLEEDDFLVNSDTNAANLPKWVKSAASRTLAFRRQVVDAKSWLCRGVTIEGTDVRGFVVEGPHITGAPVPEDKFNFHVTSFRNPPVEGRVYVFMSTRPSMFGGVPTGRSGCWEVQPRVRHGRRGYQLLPMCP